MDLFLLLDDPFEPLILGAQTEDGGNGLPPFRAPSRRAFEEQQLPFAAGDGVGILSVNGTRTDGVPVAEAVAGGEGPGQVEVGVGIRKLANRGSAQNPLFDLSWCGRDVEHEIEFRRELARGVVVACRDGRAKREELIWNGVRRL